MFTKSILPGDWVKCDCPEVSGWFDVLAQLTATSYSCMKINHRGNPIEYGYLIEYKDIVERIGDRPLDTLENMYGLPTMKTCPTCKGQGWIPHYV